MEDFFFMFIGFGFFAWILRLVIHESDKDYNRELNERREFGYQKQKRKDRKAALKNDK